MIPKKSLPQYHLATKDALKNKERIYRYLKRKLSYRRNGNRPCKLTMVIIGKATNLSYDQVRYGLALLVLENKIEKWTVYSQPLRKTTYYRLPRPKLM